MNSATMNIGVHIYPFGLCFPPDTCPGVGLLDHIVILLQEIGMYEEGMATHSSILAWRRTEEARGL